MSLPHSRWKELLLMSLPVLALVIVGVARRDREPFKLVVAKAILVSMPPGTGLQMEPPDPHIRPIKVTVFLDHQGNTPQWWGQLQCPNYEARVNFSAKGRKDDGSNVGGYDVCQYDESTGRYSFTYQGDIPDSPTFVAGANCFIGVRLSTQDPQPKKLAQVSTSLPARKMQSP